MHHLPYDSSIVGSAESWSMVNAEPQNRWMIGILNKVISLGISYKAKYGFPILKYLWVFLILSFYYLTLWIQEYPRTGITPVQSYYEDRIGTLNPIRSGGDWILKVRISKLSKSVWLGKNPEKNPSTKQDSRRAPCKCILIWANHSLNFFFNTPKAKGPKMDCFPWMNHRNR